MHPLVPVVKILKRKHGGHWKKLRESGGQISKGSHQEKCPFQYFSNFQHQAFAVFWQRKTGNDNVLMKQSPILSPNFIQGSMMIIILHNVQ